MKYAGCEIYLHKGKADINKAHFDQLYKCKEEIEKEFGGKLNWERLDNRRDSRISFKFEGVGLKDEDKWDSLQDKMIETMIRLEKAFRPYIEKLEQEIEYTAHTCLCLLILTSLTCMLHHRHIQTFYNTP